MQTLEYRQVWNIFSFKTTVPLKSRDEDFKRKIFQRCYTCLSPADEAGQAGL